MPILLPKISLQAGGRTRSVSLRRVQPWPEPKHEAVAHCFGGADLTTAVVFTLQVGPELVCVVAEAVKSAKARTTVVMRVSTKMGLSRTKARR